MRLKNPVLNTYAGIISDRINYLSLTDVEELHVNKSRTAAIPWRRCILQSMMHGTVVKIIRRGSACPRPGAHRPRPHCGLASLCHHRPRLVVHRQSPDRPQPHTCQTAFGTASGPAPVDAVLPRVSDDPSRLQYQHTRTQHALTSPAVILLPELVSHLSAGLAATELSPFLVAWIYVTPDYPLVEFCSRDISQTVDRLRVQVVLHECEATRCSLGLEASHAIRLTFGSGPDP